MTAYETNTQHDPNTNNAMLGVHASASAIIQYGKIARKQGLVNVALDILSRIHTIPTVPIVDCFQKIRQQVKCYLQLAGVMGKNECMQVSELLAQLHIFKIDSLLSSLNNCSTNTLKEDRCKYCCFLFT